MDVGFFSSPSSSANVSVVKHQSFGQDMLMRSIKIVDIAYTTAIQFILAFYISTLIDNYIVRKETQAQLNQERTIYIILQIVLNYALMGILAYIARNLILYIPFPFLDGYKGFDHKKVKEVTNPTLFYAIMVANQKNLLFKTSYLYSRVVGQKGYQYGDVLGEAEDKS